MNKTAYHEADTPEDISHPALHAMQVLKHDTMFGLFDIWGNIEGRDHGADGVFYNDTRMLSRWTLSAGAMPLKLLSGGMDKDGLVFTAHLSNGPFRAKDGTDVLENTLYLIREKFLYDGAMHERVSVTNYGDHPVTLNFMIHFASDFKDLFEVRGMQRERRGAAHLFEKTDNGGIARYTGLDAAVRQCHLYFSRTPDSHDEKAASFPVTLNPHQTWTLDAAVSATQPAETRSFDTALSALRKDFGAKISPWLTVETDNAAFNDWAAASTRALALLTTQYETGPYPCAGTPWFSVPFGRDGIITALQTLPFNPGIAKSVLAYLAAHQAIGYDVNSDAQPGKILHETRACEMAMTGEVVFKKYYGSVDATPLFLMLAGEYLRATGDLSFLTSIKPSLLLALKWVEGDGDADNDGFLEYIRQTDKGLATQGWKDSHDSVFHADGKIAGAPIAFCEVQGYAYAARLAMADLAKAWGDDTESERLTADAQNLFRAFNDSFWIADGGFYALALDRDKTPCAVRSSNMGHLLWCGIVPEDRAAKIASMLMSADFFTGWGIRTIAKGESRYSPLSYHNGSVWPHDTAIAAAGFARYGFYDYALRVLQGLYQLSSHADRQFLPELLCGFDQVFGAPPVAYPTACNPQAWASGAFFMALSASLGLTLRDGMVGLTRPDALKTLVGRLDIGPR